MKYLSNASVTIAVARTATSSEGVLRYRPRDQILDPKLRFRSHTGNEGHMYVRCDLPKSTRDPLDLCASVLQERLLSPRLQAYKSRQLMWECQNANCAEGQNPYK